MPLMHPRPLIIPLFHISQNSLLDSGLPLSHLDSIVANRPIDLFIPVDDVRIWAFPALGFREPYK